MEIVKKFFFLQELQKNCGHNFNKLAAAMEKGRQQKVELWNLSVAPLLLAANVASGVGLGTNVVSQVDDTVKSATDSGKANETLVTIENLKTEIQTLMTSLLEEEQKAGRSSEVPRNGFITEHILRQLAKSRGLVLNWNVSMVQLVSHFPVSSFVN